MAGAGDSLDGVGGGVTTRSGFPMLAVARAAADSRRMLSKTGSHSPYLKSDYTMWDIIFNIIQGCNFLLLLKVNIRRGPMGQGKPKICIWRAFFILDFTKRGGKGNRN